MFPVEDRLVSCCCKQSEQIVVYKKDAEAFATSQAWQSATSVRMWLRNFKGPSIKIKLLSLTIFHSIISKWQTLSHKTPPVEFIVRGFFPVKFMARFFFCLVWFFPEPEVFPSVFLKIVSARAMQTHPHLKPLLHGSPWQLCSLGGAKLSKKLRCVHFRQNPQRFWLLGCIWAYMSCDILMYFKPPDFSSLS